MISSKAFSKIWKNSICRSTHIRTANSCTEKRRRSSSVWNYWKNRMKRCGRSSRAILKSDIRYSARKADKRRSALNFQKRGKMQEFAAKRRARRLPYFLPAACGKTPRLSYIIAQGCGKSKSRRRENFFLLHIFTKKRDVSRRLRPARHDMNRHFGRLCYAVRL